MEKSYKEIGIDLRKLIVVYLLISLMSTGKGKTCDFEKDIENEYVPGESKLDEKCRETLIAERVTPRKVHCLDLCNQYSRCKSVNFNEEHSKCLLFKVTITGLLKNGCLLTKDDDIESENTSEAQIKSRHIDVKKMHISQVFVIKCI